MSSNSPDSVLQRAISQINARLESQERSNRQSWSERAAAAVAASSRPPISSVPHTLSSTLAAPLGLMVQSSDPLSGTVISSPSVSGVYGISDFTGQSAAAYQFASGANPGTGVFSAAAAGYLGLPVSGARHMMSPEMLGAGMYASPQLAQAYAPVSSYYRAISGLLDTAGGGAIDPNALLSRVKYMPGNSELAAGIPTGYYQLPATALAQPDVAAGAMGAGPGLGGTASVSAAGYTLMNASIPGTSLKRPLNDVMLYMMDKKPRFY